MEAAWTLLSPAVPHLPALL